MQPTQPTTTEPFVVSHDPIDVSPHLDVEPTADGGIQITPEVYVKRATLAKYGEQLVKRATTEARESVLTTIAQQDAERQMIEDKRANHRNLNRFLTLAGALFIGLIVTYALTNHGLPGLPLPRWTYSLAPYSFVITILMDSSLTLYAYLRKY